jgi:alkylhydroperoxidase family enzyme
MARIPRVPARQAGLNARLAFYFTRKGMKQMSGRDLDNAIEPLEVYANAPKLFKGYAALEQATAKPKSLPKRLQALGELKAATLVQCEYCIDLGSQVSRTWGLTDEELLALPTYRTSPLFDDLDRLVMDYAVGMCRTPADVPESLVADLRRHLSDLQLVELTHLIAIENHRGRFNHALGVGAAGFSEGMVCAVPAVVEQASAN